MRPAIACAGASAPPATPAASGKADQLFQLGKERMAQQDYAAACALLAQSFDLDPASGSLLALALCHEREGKLASAYREYGEVATRSQTERRSDREAAARARAAALEPELSTLTIVAAAAAQGLEVRLDGALIEPASLGRPLPLDGGDHVVIASAPDKQPWSTQLMLAKSADKQTLSVAALHDVPPAPAAAAVLTPHAVARAAPARAERAGSGPSAGEWVGLGTIGAGVIALGAGTYFALRAGNDHTASGQCMDGVCTYGSKRNFGDSAALAFVVGGSLAATGLVIYLVSKQPSSTESVAARRPWSASAWAAPHAAGAVMRGAF